MIILKFRFYPIFGFELLGFNVVTDVPDKLTQLCHDLVFGVFLEFDKNGLLTLSIPVEQKSYAYHESFFEQFVGGTVCLQDFYDHLAQLQV
jgi:hypothetical protein